jgi:hypothetical protein
MEAGSRNKLTSERMKPNERNMGELLASDDSCYITGTESFVDRGFAQV